MLARTGVLASMLITASLSAQDWALINPAYRYNYSNDGTDTIRHQIRVMQVDTLGVDSFRFELNRVAVVCDDCPAIGNSCAGCFVRVNQPQFLGFECVQSGSDWYFFGTDTFMIRGDATIGVSWMFDEHNGITATVDDEWEEDLFGSPDNLRRILLSSNDTIVLSRSSGIVLFTRENVSYEIIGVEGAGLGRILPNLSSYFNFQQGDELVYRITCTTLASQPGGPQYPDLLAYFWKVIITARQNNPSGVNYSISSARTPNYCTFSPDWPTPSSNWTFITNEILADHPILDAYPGKAVDGSICWSDMDGYHYPRFIARHGLTQDGRDLLTYSKIGNYGRGFDAIQEVSPGLYPILSQVIGSIVYEDILGLIDVYFHFNGYHRGVNLVGAIIGGDTIIPPPFVDYLVGINEEKTKSIGIHPNPAEDYFIIQGEPGQMITIHDMKGRLILNSITTAAKTEIVTRNLKAGMYLVSVGSKSPERLIIIH